MFFRGAFPIGVSLDEYQKALVALEKATQAERNDLNRDATIQRFEFCVELAWKTSKKIMGTTTSAPKEIVREMGQSRLIDDVEFWLKAIDYRNLSSHTYNEPLADEVYKFAVQFLAYGKDLLKKLKSK